MVPSHQDHSILTGVDADGNILGEKRDVCVVNGEREYHEETKATQTNVGDRLVPTRVSVSVGEAIEESEDTVIEVAFAKRDPVALKLVVVVVSNLRVFMASTVL